VTSSCHLELLDLQLYITITFFNNFIGYVFIGLLLYISTDDHKLQDQ
jgi:hypothetical protein